MFSNLKKDDFKKLVKNNIIKMEGEGVWFYGIPSMFSLIEPLVIEIVENKNFAKIIYELGRNLAGFYKDITLDELFERLTFQGFGVFNYDLIDDKLIVTAKSNFSRICFDNYKEKVDANVDALLIGLLEEIGNRLFTKCKIKQLKCVAKGDSHCLFEIIKA